MDTGEVGQVEKWIKGEISYEKILELYASALIGFSEARSLLGILYPEFAAIRDSELDSGNAEDDDV